MLIFRITRSKVNILNNLITTIDSSVKGKNTQHRQRWFILCRNQNKSYWHAARATKWRKTARDFAVGDLILLCNEPAPRFLKYPYAIITEVKKDSDGHVRSVIARMSDGRTKNRDITKIALIATAVRTPVLCLF